MCSLAPKYPGALCALLHAPGSLLAREPAEPYPLAITVQTCFDVLEAKALADEVDARKLAAAERPMAVLDRVEPAEAPAS